MSSEKHTFCPIGNNTENMENREILYIRTIAKYKSITKAAEQLFIAQPSLTQALHRIEEDYGSVFFQRSRTGLSLTEAGSMYLDAAEKMEELYKQAEAEINGNSLTRSGHIDFGTTAIQGGVLLPEFIKRYNECFPNVELNLWEKSSVTLEHMVESGQLDMALLHRPFKNCDLNYISIYKEPLLLAISPDDPDYLRMYNGKEPPVCTSNLLSSKHFILPTEALRIRQMADSICSMAGVIPHVSFTTSSMLTSLSMAGKGMGVAVVPRYLVNIYQDSFRFATLKFPHAWNAKWELVVAYRRNYVLPTICKELVRLLQETVASMPEVFE